MTDIESMIKNFADNALTLAIHKEEVTEQVLNGLGERFLSGLNEEEIYFLKRLIDSLK